MHANAFYLSVVSIRLYELAWHSNGSMKCETWEWFMVKPQTNDIRMTCEYIRATYGWHTSTYEWHMDDIRINTSDIWMTYEYIRVTYGWHTSDIRMTYEYIRVTYEWHTNDMRVHTSDVRMTYEYIRVTYKWHTDDMQFKRKIKLTFLKLFDNSYSKYPICKRIPCMQWLFGCFGLFT